MRNPHLIPFADKYVPHIVIEINQKCNISCQACYKDKYNYTKPYDAIIEEIEIALAHRNLTLITLAGGEPTLHPQLEDIISYVSQKGIGIQFLSNGLSLNGDSLARYKKAGLKEIFLHVDSAQKRPDVKPGLSEEELNPLRSKLAAMIVKQGIICSLVATVYKKNLPGFANIVHYAYTNPNITRLLFTCCTDFGFVEHEFTSANILNRRFELKKNRIPYQKEKSRLLNQDVAVSEAKQILEQKFKMKPFGYISSSLNTKDERWLMYHSLVILLPEGKFKQLNFHPVFGRLVQAKVNRAIKNQEKISFGKVMNTKKNIVLALVYALTSLRISILWETIRFLSHLLIPGSSIHYKDLTLQQPPTFTANGEFEYCKDCPDATIRNGVMVPVCMADILLPIEEDILLNKNNLAMGPQTLMQP